ncbi:MAG: PTS sugar transporter subunit IIA [Anaerolineaceae bacterium]
MEVEIKQKSSSNKNNRLLEKQLIELDCHAATPEDAIRAAGNLMVNEGAVTPQYVEAMILAYHELGPYIVLAPNIAMPHARPESGALKESIAFVRLEKPLAFGHPENDPVKIIIPLAGVDNNAHLILLQRLSEILMESENIGTLLKTEEIETILSIFNQQEKEV